MNFLQYDGFAALFSGHLIKWNDHDIGSIQKRPVTPRDERNAKCEGFSDPAQYFRCEWDGDGKGVETKMD